MLILEDRILVKASAGDGCISFQTVSRHRKSGQRLMIVREKLEALEHEESVIANDIHSFAVLRRSISDGTVRIDFSWLSGSPERLTGWEQQVTLPYEKLMNFVRNSTEKNGPKTWSALSMQKKSHPKLVFCDQKRLRECLNNLTVRRKLSQALRDNFHYPYVDQIIFSYDYEPFSFMFREVRGGKPGICGALILHNLEGNLKKAYYSIHT